MAYCTAQGLIDRGLEDELMQLTNGGDFVDMGVLDAAIARADAEIDSYLSRRYAVPVASADMQLQTTAESIVLYRLFKGPRPPEIEADYKAAVAWLDRVAQGRADLVGGGEAVQTEPDTSFGVQSSQSVFNRSSNAY